jgi:serine/threonine-protein kinase
MGTVFLAEQIGVGNRLVALKVLNRKLLDDPDFLLRFQNEAGSTGRISQENVVTIYESAQADDGTPYIAMEFLEGESLREVLKRRKALPVAEVAEILKQAAQGLNAAHRLGIIHRDLKPDNIFLTRGDEGELVVKVVDFGIAKLRVSSTHTQIGILLGTPAYMSCEQASGMRSDELDARSDIYSLGVVAYETLTGRVPFHSDTPVGFLRKHMLEEPPPFRAVAPGVHVPPQVEAVVMRALKKEREERYLSALEFAHAFVAAALAVPSADVSQRLPSTKVVVSPARGGFDAPVPRPSTTPAQADVAAQTPPTALPARNAEAPTVQPQRSELAGGVLFSGAAASREPAAPTAPQFQIATENPRRVKYVVFGLVLLAVIGGGIWYFSQPGEQPPLPITGPSPGTTVPAGQQARVEAPLANLKPAPREAKVNPKDGLKYVWIPPGSFEMGCSPGDTECHDDEKPPHQVTITKGFWMGQTEVTVGAYKRFAGATGRQMPPEPNFGENPLSRSWSNEQMPMESVSWDDAQAYCAWAGARLPTEAEWEYAARAGSPEAQYGPIDEVAWCSDNSDQNPHQVGQKRANDFGLYDMLGNVREWVNDWFDQDYYHNSPSRDPTGPASGTVRAQRGGHWGTYPKEVRVSNRSRGDPGVRNDYSGFRCVGEVFAP